MKETTEMRQRMEEAGKDAAWAEKVRSAASWDTYAALLAEKGIEAPVEMKEAFAAGRANKTGELEDDALGSVSGGWLEGWNTCPQGYNYAQCELPRCPHRKTKPKTLDEDFLELYCDLGWWAITRRFDRAVDDYWVWPRS